MSIPDPDIQHIQLTPNRRMAQFLGQALSLDEWLSSLFPNTLSETEEFIIWEKIISNSELGETLLRASTTARQVASAWQLCLSYRIKHFDPLLVTEDSGAYLKWSNEYRNRCQREGWIDSKQRVDQIIEAVVAGKMPLPCQIQLVGFDEHTPQIKELFDCIAHAGTEVVESSIVGTTVDMIGAIQGQVFTFSAENPDMELRYAAVQAQKWLNQNPKARIGIVIPDLERRRQSVVRIFQETLSNPLFNIAAPVSLGSYPFIQAALLCLGLAKEEISLENISLWLRSPFFEGGIQESIGRSAFDVFLREAGELFFSWSRLLSQLDYYSNELNISVGVLKNTLEKFYALFGRKNECAPTFLLSAKNTTEHWCVVIQQLLIAVGWPGERTLSSQEYQLRLQWDLLLETYQKIGRVLGKHTFSEALFRLKSLSKEISFLPQSVSAPVQILGVLEAAGIPFDYLWVAGMHREAWPPDPSPNPFIPLSIQRVVDLPRSSAKRELKVATRLTQRLCQGAPFVIFSYPSTVDDQPCAKSALLNNFPEMTTHQLGSIELSTDIYKMENMSPSSRIARIDEQAPKLAEDQKIQQGAKSIQLQAACPFRAFSEIRLMAKPLAISTLGLTPAIRGEILHQILMHFWEGLDSQAALNALTDLELEQRIKNSIELSLNTWQSRRPKTLTPKYKMLEQKRLFKLINQMISIEKSRPAFQVVAREQRYVVTLAGFQLSVRIDRIDKTADGEEIILDYKTGITSVGHWFGERPKDPQLPIYCITRPQLPVGVAFFSIRPEGVKFQGLAKNQDLLPGVKTTHELKRWGSDSSFEEQCERWSNTVTKLAEDFSAGVATVDPIDGKNTCRTCSLQPLCRIHSLDHKL